nr:NlpC/P60 family protein [Kordiimonas marina]
MTDWLGIPFVPHGRDYTGADCYGLVRLFYADVMGVHLPRLRGLVRDVGNPRETGPLMRGEAHGPLWRPVPDPAFGDILAFGTPALFTHVGIYLRPGLMLHTRTGTDSTPERYDSPIWQPRLQGFFRYKDFSYA